MSSSDLSSLVRRSAVLAVALLASAACSRLPFRSAPPPPAPNALTDANIAAIVVAANDADIRYADLALGKSQDAAVQAFARMVKTDHNALNAAAVALVTRLKVVPQGHTVSFDIRDDADTKIEAMKLLTGAAFDSAYAANEVSYHQTVLDAIDQALIPSAQNPELKALLVEARPAVAAHKGHAENLVRGVAQRRAKGS